VLTGDQGKFVYVAEKGKDGKTVATVHPITEGGWQGKNWVILSGLKAGDQVIVDNLIKTRPGAEISPHPYSELAASSQPAAK
jgi:membrane fusion protein (multidrug efflux system)